MGIRTSVSGNDLHDDRTAIERIRRETIRRLQEIAPDVIREEIRIVPLGVNESIGSPKPFTDFALHREERLVEATFRLARGQAFTGSPDSMVGKSGRSAPPAARGKPGSRFFTAGVNAVGRALGWGTIRSTAGRRSRKVRRKIRRASGAENPERTGNVAIVGYQPALLQEYRTRSDRTGSALRT
jgi:hypothetical protein